METVERFKKAVWQTKNIYLLVYIGIAVWIIGPLLKPGYIFALDMVFPPHLRFPHDITSYVNVEILLYILNFIFPSWLLQKVMLIGALVLAGTGMHRLIPGERQWPKYFAGILFMANPFVFQRATVGQLGVVMAYAISPFAMKLIFDFIRKPGLKQALSMGAVLAAVFSFSLHGFVTVAIFGAAAFAVIYIREKDARAQWKPLLSYGLVAILLLGALNGIWLNAYLHGTGSTTKTLSAISRTDVIGFQTKADPKLGVFFNTAAMYGFWGENTPRSVIMHSVVPGWYIVFSLMLVLFLWGAVAGIRDKKTRSASIAFAVSGAIAFVLAVGVASRWTAPVFWFVFDHVPFFSGFRDAQKFVVLLIPAYCWFGAAALNDITARITGFKAGSKQALAVFAVFAFLLPVYYSFPMSFGFGGALTVKDYPSDWYQVKGYLDKNAGNAKSLFLPWHQYMHFTFSGKVMVNPAKSFFEVPMLQGDNIEFGPIYTQMKNPASKFIETAVLQNGRKTKELGKQLATRNIKYILLAKEADYEHYGYIDKQDDLEVVLDTQNITVYLNKAYK